MNVLIRDGRKKRSAQLAERIGGGGEGTVYAVVDAPEILAKVYLTETAEQRARLDAREKKIKTMLASPPRVVSTKLDDMDMPLLAWPTSLVENDAGDFVGFIMPYIRPDNSCSQNFYLRELGRPKELTEKERCLTGRLSLCRNLAGIVADLHAQGHYIVDFKPDNLRIFRGNCIPSFLDTDSFSIAGKRRRYPASVITPEYSGPELLERPMPDTVTDDTHDRFAVAILIFQILNKGIHPFQGSITSPVEGQDTSLKENISQRLYAYGLERDSRIGPTLGSDHDCLPVATRRLFDRAFGSAAPTDRPTAAEWRAHFDDYLYVTKPFARCSRNPDSALHIHFRGHECTECRREALRSMLRRPAAAATPAISAPPVTLPTRSLWKRLPAIAACVLILAVLWYVFAQV